MKRWFSKNPNDKGDTKAREPQTSWWEEPQAELDAKTATEEAETSSVADVTNSSSDTAPTPIVTTLDSQTIAETDPVEPLDTAYASDSTAMDEQTPVGEIGAPVRQSVFAAARKAESVDAPENPLTPADDTAQFNSYVTDPIVTDPANDVDDEPITQIFVPDWANDETAIPGSEESMVVETLNDDVPVDSAPATEPGDDAGREQTQVYSESAEAQEVVDEQSEEHLVPGIDEAIDPLTAPNFYAAETEPAPQEINAPPDSIPVPVIEPTVGFGEQIERLIAAAVAQAEQTKSDAITEADRLVTAARNDAEYVTAQAQRQAADIIAATQRRADAQLADAQVVRDEADQILTRARMEADELRRKVRDETAQLRTEIDQHARTTLERTHADTNRTLSQARAELAEIASHKAGLEEQMAQLRALLSEMTVDPNA